MQVTLTELPKPPCDAQTHWLLEALVRLRLGETRRALLILAVPRLADRGDLIDAWGRGEGHRHGQRAPL
jgi:hypothetical protein